MTKKISEGTKKWCPYCKAIRVCKAINPSIVAENGQLKRKINHEDIHWFRRCLMCHTCEKIWLTAEIHENFLTELVQLRESLSEIQENTDIYIEKSKNTNNSLIILEESLDKLREIKRPKLNYYVKELLEIKKEIKRERIEQKNKYKKWKKKFRRQNNNEIIKEIENWFFQNYEDPAENCPNKESKSGYDNYEYIWGGPYDTREEVEYEFGEVVSEEIIDEAVDNLEINSCWVWSGISNHPEAT